MRPLPEGAELQCGSGRIYYSYFVIFSPFLNIEIYILFSLIQVVMYRVYGMYSCPPPPVYYLAIYLFFFTWGGGGRMQHKISSFFRGGVGRTYLIRALHHNLIVMYSPPPPLLQIMVPVVQSWSHFSNLPQNESQDSE